MSVFLINPVKTKDDLTPNQDKISEFHDNVFIDGEG